MSKASDAAARGKLKYLPEFCVDNLWYAEVNLNGHLVCRGGTYLEAKDALKLADWIYDTFGEPDAKPEEP